MDMVEELYRGLIKPLEDFGYSTDKTYIILRERLEQAEQKILSELSENDKQTYEQIRGYYIKMQNMEVQRMFEYSFRLGVQLATDIFHE